jgi:hypothetical protein
MFVHVSETEYSLIHNTFYFLFGESLFSVFHKLVDVLFHEFKNEVEVVVDSNNFF